MNILLVNNFYYNRGGDCTYLFSLQKLLEAKGHKVSIFSMHHPQNIESGYSKYFVSHIDYAEEMKRKNIHSGIKVLSRSIYSIEAKNKMKRLIDDEKPDIVHLNNIRHHLTPSILRPIKKYNLPVVWTLHDYQLICPNIAFLAGGRICEKCKKRKYYWPPVVRCKKDSFLASAMAAVEHTAQFLTHAYDAVDFYIAPSEFVKSKFVEYGFDENKIICLRHFTDAGCGNSNDKPGDYILYIGRLSEEKGIKTLIEAVSRVGMVKLKIAGDGPLREELESNELFSGGHNIEFLGQRSRKEIIELIKNCRFLVVPSEWYEVLGLVILEAFACGKTVIGSRIGGIPELIRDNETGVTFEAGNIEDLISKIEYLDRYPDRIQEMGESGRSFVQQELGADKYYKALMEIYKMAAEIKRKNAK
jgi:glycosyltransferase involved in cell wall biosynthesis